MKYLRGSEWRKWDLHVHTPESVLNHSFGTDFDHYAKIMLKSAIDNEIAVIGVTDYWTLEGFKKLKEIVDGDERLVKLLGEEDAEKARQILLLPNIEFRSRELIVDRHGSAKVNFHVIFSEEIPVEEIEERFLHNLKFIFDGDPNEPDKYRTLTLANLEDLGRTLQAQHGEFRSESELFTGMNNAAVNHTDVSEVLNNQSSTFRSKYLFVVAADEDLSRISWNGQGHLLRKTLIQKSHMIFSANDGTREFGLGRRHGTPEEFVKEFKSKKPCIHGSDAHDYDHLFAPDLGRFLWIKADPTFNGLRQLLHEPEDRVFIGDLPFKLRVLGANQTKFFSDLSFDRSTPLSVDEKWFSGTVPFNCGLVAIIGNKGSGKSALADIVALLGNSTAQEDFSFLVKKRFLEPKKNLGNHFVAELSWQSGETVSKSLADKVDRLLPERVKYIPQNYLDRICSEIEQGNGTEFDQELQDVIFSHVESADRLGKSTLADLIDFRTSEKNLSIEKIADQIHDVNSSIAELEQKASADFRDVIQGKLNQKKIELQALADSLPTSVAAPEDDASSSAELQPIKDELNDFVTTIQTLDDQIAADQRRLGELALKSAASDRLLERIENLTRSVDAFYEASDLDSLTLNLEMRDIVRLEVDDSAIRTAKDDAVREMEPLRTTLDPDNVTSLFAQKLAAQRSALETREKLDEPNRKYQEYLQQTTLWNQRKAELEGSAEITDSLLGLEAQLDFLSSIPARIDGLKTRRSELVKEIYAIKNSLLEQYKLLYRPVQQFIDKNPVSGDIQALEFSADISAEGLVDGMLRMIHQGRKGTFQGDQEGRDRLNELVSRSDFSSAAGAQMFIDEFLHLLTEDSRDTPPKERQIGDQLKAGIALEDFYDSVFSLDYLQPKFSLQWLGKALDKLSPGERGTLLLVFYLLIDRRDIPLIIDQPEENLDNETVTSSLVPAIKYAKKRRQIVIVTHNPNLAVVCDAEQVIYSQIDKTDGNTVTYQSGSLEANPITQHVVDVLEGTKPAFDLRDARYEILES